MPVSSVMLDFSNMQEEGDQSQRDEWGRNDQTSMPSRRRMWAASIQREDDETRADTGLVSRWLRSGHTSGRLNSI